MVQQSLIEKKAQSNITVGGLTINLQRTCRVAEGQLNSLPAGLGSFPLYKTEDFKSGLPSDWEGFFMPMYIQEAMWMNFHRHYNANPSALMVGAGSINAVSGERMEKTPSGFTMKLEKEQNYMVVPPQPWIDGWKDTDGKIYQFVAARMGSGETVEGQITGEEKKGGIQFAVFNPKPGQKLTKSTRPREYISGGSWDGFPGEIAELCFLGDSSFADDPVAKSGPVKSNACSLDAVAPSLRALRMRSPHAESSGLVEKATSIQAMGLGRGGEISQSIYPDPHGLQVWQSEASEKTVLYMVDEESFFQITGQRAPPTPVTYEKYQQYGLPWFNLHDKQLGDSSGSDVFGKLHTVKGKVGKKTVLE